MSIIQECIEWLICGAIFAVCFWFLFCVIIDRNLYMPEDRDC